MKNKVTILIKKVKNKLNSWNWRKIEAAFVFFLLLGMGLAIYQYYNINHSSPSSQSPANPKLNVDTKPRNYSLNNEKLKLSANQNQNKKENQTEAKEEKQEEKPQQSIKVDSSAPRANFKNLVRPVQGEIVSTCEWYHDETLDAWKYNPGMDFKAEIGTKVKTVQAGEVSEINKDDYKGVTIIITHNENYKTKYANLRKAEVKPKTQVTKGQVIGEVGDSGSNQNNKLHLEIIKQGDTVPPTKYFD